MYRKLSEKLVDAYSCNWDENERMRETCICGVEILCSTLGNILILILLACLLSKQKEILLFFIVYGVSRMYAGGIHARNHFECMLLYTLILLASIYVAACLAGKNVAMYVAGVVVPVVTLSINIRYGGKQKKLSENERLIYQKKCRVVILFFNIALIALEIWTGFRSTGRFVEEAFWIMAFALLAQSVSLFLEGKKGNMVE